MIYSRAHEVRTCMRKEEESCKTRWVQPQYISESTNIEPIVTNKE